MGQYRQQLLITVSAFAAVLTAALQKSFFPGPAAAGWAVFAACIYARYADTVSKHFRTDVERVLEPNMTVYLLGFGCIIIGMLVGFAIGTPVGAALGFLVAILATMKLIK